MLDIAPGSPDFSRSGTRWKSCYKMNNSITRIVFAFVLSALVATPSHAADFKYRSKISLKTGQSVVIKGVRHDNCGKTAPGWGRVKGGLPRSRLGVFGDGGTGTVDSKSCGGRVAARGVKFTARQPGQETLTIYDDRVSITVTGKPVSVSASKPVNDAAAVPHMERYVNCLFSTYESTVKKTRQLKYNKNTLKKACNGTRKNLTSAQLSVIEPIAFRGIDEVVRRAR